MENVQDYTLSSRRGKEPVYALIVISSVREAPEKSSNANIYMVEKVQPVKSESVESLRPILRRLTRFAMKASNSTATHGTPIKWTPDRGPGHAKKARRLGAHTTDAEMPSPTG